jgi:hypothetical protein
VLLAEIDTDKKRERRRYGSERLNEERGDEAKREREKRREKGKRERKRGVEIYVTGESASIACCKRAGSCPLLATRSQVLICD